MRIDKSEVRVQVRVVGDDIYGSTWGSGKLIATTKKQESAIQGLPVITIEEIKNAKIVVENEGVQQQAPNRIVFEANSPRVRFVLKGREIVYDRSGFRVEATSSNRRRSSCIVRATRLFG